jgi:hypothetical protein
MMPLLEIIGVLILEKITKIWVGMQFGNIGVKSLTITIKPFLIFKNLLLVTQFSKFLTKPIFWNFQIQPYLHENRGGSWHFENCLLILVVALISCYRSTCATWACYDTHESMLILLRRKPMFSFFSRRCTNRLIYNVTY